MPVRLSRPAHPTIIVSRKVGSKIRDLSNFVNVDHVMVIVMRRDCVERSFQCWIDRKARHLACRRAPQRWAKKGIPLSP